MATGQPLQGALILMLQLIPFMTGVLPHLLASFTLSISLTYLIFL